VSVVECKVFLVIVVVECWGCMLDSLGGGECAGGCSGIIRVVGDIWVFQIGTKRARGGKRVFEAWEWEEGGSKRLRGGGGGGGVEAMASWGREGRVFICCGDGARGFCVCE